VPERSRVAVLFDSRNGGSAAAFKSQVAVAPTLGQTLIPVDVRSDAELEKGLERVLRERADVIATHPVVADYGNRIAEFATRHRLPIFDGGGAFVSYGAVYSAAFDWRHVLHWGGVYVARILKGARPSDLPVEQASRIIVVVNLKAAKALGLAIPQSVLLRPDQVIE